MSAFRSLRNLTSGAVRLAACSPIAESVKAGQANPAALSCLQAIISSPTSRLPETDILPPARAAWTRAFSSAPIHPNPLGSTNTSGVGDNPLDNSSSAQASSTKSNPLTASTAISTGSSTKPTPPETSPGSPSNLGPKPDPLAASTNVKPDTSGASTSSFSFQQNTYDGPPKLIVFGGNGFVGTRVCEEALQTGLAVVSINRSGAPKATASWTSEVDWISADAFEPGQWRDQLQGAVGVVSCLGGFGSNDFMLKICGEANVGVIREAAQAGVPRCAFVSVHDYKFPGFVLQGYFQGKRNAELAMAEAYPDQGVCLRPGFIHGTRYVSGVGVPLSFIGAPLEKALGFLPAKSLSSMPLAGAAFVPPTSVQAVAKAAVAAATDPAVPGGIMDVWQLQQYEA